MIFWLFNIYIYISFGLLLICGIIGLYLQRKVDDIVMKQFIAVYSYILIAYGLFLLDSIRNYFLIHRKKASHIFMVLFYILSVGFIWLDIFDLTFFKEYGYMFQMLGSCFLVIGISLKNNT